MKTIAAVGFVLLAFAVWWPSGVALLLIGLWIAGSRKNHDAPAAAGNVASAELEKRALLQDNLRLQHELALRDIHLVMESIQAKVDEALDNDAMKHPSIPAYHAWHIIHDLSHDVLKGAHDADPKLRASMLALLQYIDGACESLVRLVSVDERWKLYAGRPLEFEDFREMRGLARVAMDEMIRLAMKVP
jgi:hypothetical protein